MCLISRSHRIAKQAMILVYSRIQTYIILAWGQTCSQTLHFSKYSRISAIIIPTHSDIEEPNAA